MSDPMELWRRYRRHLWRSKDLGIALDISRMRFEPDFWQRMQPAMERAFEQMRRLEGGAVANPDEDRMVGHYWLRDASLAPDEQIAEDIRRNRDHVHTFAADVHQKRIAPPVGERFTDGILIGIGGSALGPELIADALGSRRDKLHPHFLDNTDPNGFERVLAAVRPRLKSTLVLVVSKSGTTAETRNGMLAVRRVMEGKGLDFPAHAVAITGRNSALDTQAREQGWLARFPMWDWVGGRTSVTSPVGLVPAALEGVDIDALLDGAAAMDRHTRVPDVSRNPAARLALMWYFATGGRAEKNMVILPYRDRLVLLGRYLQQLVMESLGKARDLDGQPVQQGITVYGNKGSTDQHAFIQQLREGPADFFATFLVVLKDVPRRTQDRLAEMEVDEHVTAGDYLLGFWQGTREALWEKGRDSITITLERLDARTLGALIALYERTVGLYAELIHVNAYDQPGVEAGKKAAKSILALQPRLVEELERHPGESFRAEDLAKRIGEPERAEAVHHILEHLAANRRHAARRGRRYRYRKPG